MNWQEMKDLQIASVITCVSDTHKIAIFAGLYNYAANMVLSIYLQVEIIQLSVLNLLEWTYINDIRMMKDIHKKFGHVA